MDFAGIRYWTYGSAEIAHVMRGALPHAILLAHTPKRLLEAQQLAVPAVISGHTHGGQIVLPGDRRDRGARVPGRSPGSSSARGRRSS